MKQVFSFLVQSDGYSQLLTLFRINATLRLRTLRLFMPVAGLGVPRIEHVA